MDSQQQQEKPLTNKFDLPATAISVACLAVACLWTAVFGCSPTCAETAQATGCTVECIQPHVVAELHAPQPEGPNVLETVKKLAKGRCEGNRDVLLSMINDECTIVDDASGRLSVGKKAVVDGFNEDFDQVTSKGRSRISDLKILDPFVKVRGNNAVVTYKAVRTLTGSKPHKEEAFMTEVFEKNAGKWLLVHSRGKWETVEVP